MARASLSPESPASPVRGAVRIPRDQAALLDKSESWKASLEASNHSLGLVNLPADVLKPLEDFHRKRLQKRLMPTETKHSRKQNVDAEPREPREPRKRGEPQENAGGKDSTSPCTTPEAGATDPATPTKGRALAVNHGSDDSNQQFESSPEILVSSWPTSPNREPVEYAERSSSPDIAQTRPQPQLPPSSLELEEELEITAPRGMRDPAGPTNLGTAGGLAPSLSPGYTSSRPPPCGQGDRPLIDADFDDEAEEDIQADSESMDHARDVPGRRSRRMQGPVFPSVTPQKTSHFGNRHATAKMKPVPRLSMLDSSQASLSSIDAQTSPAGDSSTCEAPGPGKRQNPHPPNPDLTDEASSKRMRTLYSDRVHGDSARRETLPSPSRKETRQPPAAGLPTSAAQAAEPRKQQMDQTQRPDLNLEPSSMRQRTSHGNTYPEGAAREEIIVPATPLERYPNLVMTGRTAQPVRQLKPFEAYREAYPAYHGTLTDFINACISLEYIQRQDLMRDLLYDDFIHTWVEGYVGYVAKYGDGALPANQWFNRLGGGVEFDKMVITRKNLHLVPGAYPKAYPKEYREELQALKLDQSPERPTASRAFAQTGRPGSAQEAIPRSRQATPKRHLNQNVPATLPQASRVAPEVQIPQAGISSSQHSTTVHYGNGQTSASSQPPLVIPATQSPRPTDLNQRSRSGSVQGPYHHPSGKRPLYPQAPHSVIAESPFKRVVTPKEDVRHSMPPPGYPGNDTTLQQGLVSEERPPPVSLSKIAYPSIVPVGIRDNSDTDDFSPTRVTTQAPEEAGITPMRQNGDDRLGTPSGPREAPGVGDANVGLTVHHITSPDPPSSSIRPDGSKTKHAGTSDRPSKRGARSPDLHSSATSESVFERSRVRSPDLHSSAYASPSPPGRKDSGDEGPRNANSVPAKTQHAEVYTSLRTKGKETRGPRHSIATGNPRASSGNDKRVMDGRVHKDAGRKSLDSKGGQEESEKSGGKMKKKKRKKRRETMEEALEKFLLKKWAEEPAAASPASRQSPASRH